MSALEICFCCPAGDHHLSFAYRFLQTYLNFPPMIEHELIILTGPGDEAEAVEIVAACNRVKVVPTPDFAKDLSRYETWVKQSTAECVMMLGGSTYCRRPGWGLRAFTAFQQMGRNNLYGACGHTGAGPVRPHLRSTGFWGSPSMLARYPGWPRNEIGRYTAEHGSGCMSDWFASQGATCWVINFGSQD